MKLGRQGRNRPVPLPRCCPGSDTRNRELGHCFYVAELPHIWPISCRKDRQVGLVLAQSESAALSNQPGIESCRGRSIESRRLPKRLPMRSFSRAQMKSGARPLPTPARVTHLVLRHTEVACHLADEELNSTLLSPTRLILGRPLRHDGILELLACYNEPTRREPFSPRSRYQGSLMGSHDSLTGRSL